MVTTASAEIKGLDFSGMFFGAISRPVMKILEKQQWYQVAVHWPYWKEALIGTGIFFAFLILLWFYRNWLR